MWHGVQSSISNSVNNPQSIYFSPRVGMAWDIFGHGNTVLHGGWGVYRHQEEFAPYAAAAATAQGYKTTYLQQQWNFDGVDEQSPINPSDFNVNVRFGDRHGQAGHLSVQRHDLSTHYHHAVQERRLQDSLVEVAYVGTSMQHLSSYNAGRRYNEASDLNLIPAGYMFGDQTTNGFCLCNLPANLSAVSIGALTTAGQDYFRPYPFYQHIYMLNHNFYGNYNGLQASFNKSAGWLQFGANYTFSKTLATAASYNNQIVDPVNLRNDYNPMPYDRTNVFNVHYRSISASATTATSNCSSRLRTDGRYPASSSFRAASIFPPVRARTSASAMDRCRYSRCIRCSRPPRPRLLRSACSNTTFRRIRTAISTASRT